MLTLEAVRAHQIAGRHLDDSEIPDYLKEALITNHCGLLDDPFLNLKIQTFKRFNKALDEVSLLKPKGQQFYEQASQGLASWRLSELVCPVRQARAAQAFGDHCIEKFSDIPASNLFFLTIIARPVTDASEAVGSIVECKDRLKDFFRHRTYLYAGRFEVAVLRESDLLRCRSKRRTLDAINFTHTGETSVECGKGLLWNPHLHLWIACPDGPEKLRKALVRYGKGFFKAPGQVMIKPMKQVGTKQENLRFVAGYIHKEPLRYLTPSSIRATIRQSGFIPSYCTDFDNETLWRYLACMANIKESTLLFQSRARS